MRFKLNFRLITGFIIALGLLSCEKNTDSQISLRLKKEYLKDKIWLSIDSKGNPRIKNHQKCSLVFLENNEYEVRKTFEYSGSTFRNPGTYLIKDSLIQLRSFNGEEHLGNVYIYDRNKLKVKWLQAEVQYGKGVDIFKAGDNS